jgi:hypothetical protein
MARLGRSHCTRVPAGFLQSKNIEARRGSNLSDVKVRRLPVVDREKRLVGIVSIGDLAKSDNASSTGHAVADITAPGGAHSQRSGSKRRNAKRV